MDKSIRDTIKNNNNKSSSSKQSQEFIGHSNNLILQIYQKKNEIQTNPQKTTDLKSKNTSLQAQLKNQSIHKQIIKTLKQYSNHQLKQNQKKLSLSIYLQQPIDKMKQTQLYKNFELINIPRLEQIYIDNENNEYKISRNGELIYKNNKIDDYYLKCKYNELRVDLYNLKDSTHYIYKGQENTQKQIQNQSNVQLTFYHDYAAGFPFQLNMKLTDPTTKILQLCNARNLSTEVNACFIHSFDITQYNGTIKQFLIEIGQYQNNQDIYNLPVDCLIHLTENMKIGKDIDHKKYFFASYNISNNQLFRRLVYTLEANDDDELDDDFDYFETFLGFGLYDKQRGICDMKYQDKIIKIKNLLKGRGIRQSEINRLFFEKINIDQKDQDKFVIKISVNNKINNHLKNISEKSYQESTHDLNHSFTTASDS